MPISARCILKICLRLNVLAIICGLRWLPAISSNVLACEVPFPQRPVIAEVQFEALLKKLRQGTAIERRAALNELASSDLSDIPPKKLYELEKVFARLCKDPDEQLKRSAVWALVMLSGTYSKNESESERKKRRDRIWNEISPVARIDLFDAERAPSAMALFLEFDRVDVSILPALMQHLREHRMSTELFRSLRKLGVAAAETAPLLRKLLNGPEWTAEAFATLTALDDSLEFRNYIAACIANNSLPNGLDDCAVSLARVLRRNTPSPIATLPPEITTLVEIVSDTDRELRKRAQEEYEQILEEGSADSLCAPLRHLLPLSSAKTASVQSETLGPARYLVRDPTILDYLCGERLLGSVIHLTQNLRSGLTVQQMREKVFGEAHERRLRAASALTIIVSHWPEIVQVENLESEMLSLLKEPDLEIRRRFYLLHSNFVELPQRLEAEFIRSLISDTRAGIATADFIGHLGRKLDKLDGDQKRALRTALRSACRDARALQINETIREVTMLQRQLEEMLGGVKQAKTQPQDPRLAFACDE